MSAPKLDAHRGDTTGCGGGAGEIPVGFVVLRADAGADAEEPLAFVAARVVPYARLRGLRLVDALPVSAAGKILKQRLKEQWIG